MDMHVWGMRFVKKGLFPHAPSVLYYRAPTFYHHILGCAHDPHFASLFMQTVAIKVMW